MQAITDRTVAYGLSVIHLYRRLEGDPVGRILGRQLLRSGTSIGANIEEAQGAQSKRDFITKLSIAHKEARESTYWLRLIKDARLLPEGVLSNVMNETTQLVKILSSSLLTAKASLNSTDSSR